MRLEHSQLNTSSGRFRKAMPPSQQKMSANKLTLSATVTNYDNTRLNKSAQVSFGGFLSPIKKFASEQFKTLGEKKWMKDFVLSDKFVKTCEYPANGGFPIVETLFGAAVSLTIKPFTMLRMKADKKDKENAVAKAMGSAVIDAGISSVIFLPIQRSFQKIDDILQKTTDEVKIEVAKEKVTEKVFEEKVSQKLEKESDKSVEVAKRAKNFVADEILKDYEKCKKTAKSITDEVAKRLTDQKILSGGNKYLSDLENFKIYKFISTYGLKPITVPLRASLSIAMIPITYKIVFGKEHQSKKQAEKAASLINKPQNPEMNKIFKDFIGAQK